MAVFLGTLINQRQPTDLSKDSKPSTKESKTSSVAIEIFSETGRLSEAHRQWSKKLNPFYALWNCQRTSIATARFLETGISKPAKIIPLIVFDLADLHPHVLPGMRKDRTYAHISCTRETLEDIMRILGPSTHAMIWAHSTRFTSHLFNYVYHEAVDGTCHFEIMDGYGGSFTKMGFEQPKAFFSQYMPMMKCIVFFDAIQNKHLVMNEKRTIECYYKKHENRSS